MFKVPTTVLITGVVLLELVGDIFLKKWAIHDWGMVGFVLGTCMYLGATLLWASSLEVETLARAGLIYGVIALIAGVCTGLMFFHEHLSIANWIGFVLAIISIILIELF